jgi:putative endonuclease
MPDLSPRARRGHSGEAHARAWLEGRGYACVATNWHCRAGELDLVMRDGEELVFVEVKTRTGERFGHAAEAVTDAKRRKLLAAAEWFIAEHPEWQDAIWRCDLVAVTIDPRTGTAAIEHYDNALFDG